MLTTKTQRQLIATSSPPTTGPRAAIRPPIAVQTRTLLSRVLARARRQDHAQRGGRHQRRAGRLDDAEDDQRERVVRRSAERRRDGEHGDPEQEAVLAREAIGQAPEDDEQGRVDDRVSVQDPREIAQPGRAEVMRDVRQRDVDDEHIQNCEGEADRDDQQDKRRRGVATTSEELTKGGHSQAP